MFYILLFFQTNISKSVPTDFDALPSAIGMTLEDVVNRFELRNEKYWLGGGAGDHILQYCIMSDFNENSYYIWIDVPRMLIPNEFLDKERDQKLSQIFNSVKGAKVIFISVINTSGASPSNDKCKIPPLNYFSGKKVRDVLVDLGIKNKRIVTVYNNFENMHVMRIATRSGLVFELQVKPKVGLNGKTEKRRKPYSLMCDPVHLLRIYAGSHSPLKVQLLSLDGRRR